MSRTPTPPHNESASPPPAVSLRSRPMSRFRDGVDQKPVISASSLVPLDADSATSSPPGVSASAVEAVTESSSAVSGSAFSILSATDISLASAAPKVKSATGPQRSSLRARSTTPGKDRQRVQFEDETRSTKSESDSLHKSTGSFGMRSADLPSLAAASAELPAVAAQIPLVAPPGVDSPLLMPPPVEIEPSTPFKIIRARPNGACLFASVKMAMDIVEGRAPNPNDAEAIQHFRLGVISYMADHRADFEDEVIFQLIQLTADNRLEIIPEPLRSTLRSMKIVQDENPTNAIVDKFIAAYLRGPGWDSYLESLRNPDAWGGNVELAAIQKKYDLKITVHYTRPQLAYCLGVTGQNLHLLFSGDHYDLLLQNPEADTLASELYHPFISDSAPHSDSETDASSPSSSPSDAFSSRSDLSASASASASGVSAGDEFTPVSMAADSEVLGSPAMSAMELPSPTLSAISVPGGSRHLGRHPLDRHEFDVYASTMNAQCLYIALLENMTRYLMHNPAHPIHLLANSMELKRELSKEISENSSKYLDDIIAEIIRTIQTKQLASFSGPLKISLLEIVKTEKFSAAFLDAKHKARDLLHAQTSIRNFLEKDGGFLKYCNWISTPASQPTEVELRAASQRFAMNIVLYNNDRITVPVISNPGWPILFFQKTEKGYMQLVPKSELINSRILPFFVKESSLKGFSEYAPDYIAASPKDEEAARPKLSPEANLAGQRLFAAALKAIQERDLPQLQILVPNHYAKEQLFRKIGVLTEREHRAQFTAVKQVDIWNLRRVQLQEFIGAKKKLGHMLTLNELSAQLEAASIPLIDEMLAMALPNWETEEVEETLVATGEKIKKSVRRIKTEHWIGGIKYPISEARAKLRQEIENALKPFLTLSIGYRQYEFTPELDKKAHAKSVLSRENSGSIAYIGDRVKDLADLITPELCEAQIRLDEAKLLTIFNKLEVEASALLDAIRSRADKEPAAEREPSAQREQKVRREAYNAGPLLISLITVKRFKEIRNKIIESFKTPIDRDAFGVKKDEEDEAESKRKFPEASSALPAKAKFSFVSKEKASASAAAAERGSSSSDSKAHVKSKKERTFALNVEWSTPLTLSEIRIRIMFYLQHFVQHNVLAYRSDLEKSEQWLDQEAALYVFRAHTATEHINRKLEAYKRSLEEQINPIIEALATWRLGDNETTKTTRLRIAKEALKEADDAIQYLNAIINSKGEEDALYLTEKLATLNENSDREAALRSKIMSDDGCLDKGAPSLSGSEKDAKASDALDPSLPEATQEELKQITIYGLLVDACDADGKTLLHHALSGVYNEEQVAIVRYLLSGMASVNVYDTSRRSPGLAPFLRKVNPVSDEELALASTLLELCIQAHVRDSHADLGFRVMLEHFIVSHRAKERECETALEVISNSPLQRLLLPPSSAAALEADSKFREKRDQMEIAPGQAPLILRQMSETGMRASTSWRPSLFTDPRTQLRKASKESIRVLETSHGFCRFELNAARLADTYLRRLRDESAVRVVSVNLEELLAARAGEAAANARFIAAQSQTAALAARLAVFEAEKAAREAEVPQPAFGS